MELKTALPPMRRTLALVVHKTKPLGSTAQGFVRHCLDKARPA